MKFIDVATISVKSGDGGPGHLSFRREKGVPKGGPDGGNGGKGGDVILKVDAHMNTLLDFKYRRHYTAEDGRPGEKSQCTGRSGENLYIRVPKGTLIKDAASGEILADLVNESDEYIAARGGIGGRGNAEFATPTNQAPRKAEPGRPGEEIEITLELKLLADVGIIGFPNAGKSTLISVISAARPKIADYPFTTLEPNLGIVKIGDYQNFTVADMPGLIEGASQGKGLGIQFLRHIERTSLLLYLIDCMSLDPVADYRKLRGELKKYKSDLDKKKKIICLSKMDVLDEDGKKKLKKLNFRTKGVVVHYISSVSNEGLKELKNILWEMVRKDKQ